MWVITVGPFRGKRMQGVKIFGAIVLVIVLAMLLWHFFAGPAESEPDGKQRASDVALAIAQERQEAFFVRILAHLRSWYNEGF